MSRSFNQLSNWRQRSLTPEGIQKKFQDFSLKKSSVDIATNLVPSVNGRINAMVAEQRDRFYARKLFEMTLKHEYSFFCEKVECR